MSLTRRSCLTFLLFGVALLLGPRQGLASRANPIFKNVKMIVLTATVRPDSKTRRLVNRDDVLTDLQTYLMARLSEAKHNVIVKIVSRSSPTWPEESRDRTTLRVRIIIDIQSWFDEETSEHRFLGAISANLARDKHRIYAAGERLQLFVAGSDHLLLSGEINKAVRRYFDYAVLGPLLAYPKIYIPDFE